MINIVIKSLYKNEISPNLLEKTAIAVLAHEKITRDVDLSIVIDDDEKLQELNRTFLGNDYPTDVLAFPEQEIDPDSQNLYIGDVIISYPKVLSQAKENGHSISKEIKILVIHGLLHLLGFDHGDENEKDRMFRVQEEILISLTE